MSLPLQRLDCSARMFISSLCLTPEDLDRLGIEVTGTACCLSRETQARSVAHWMMGEDEQLARRITDLLDLRYATEVLHVRSLSVEEVHDANALRARQGFGQTLVGWSWALLTDPRQELGRLGHNLMGECYVRGMQHLADADGALTRTPSERTSR